MKEHKKFQKNEPLLTFMRRLVLKISRFKVINMNVTIFLNFTNNFRLNEDHYNVIVAQLENNGKIKV